jgi:HEAT repeat protein
MTGAPADASPAAAAAAAVQEDGDVPGSGFEDAVERLATTEGWRSAYPQLEQAGALALDALIAGLAHRHPRVRQWCTALLDHHADERCLPGLLRLLEDPVAGVRRHALHSIGCQPCKPVPLAIDVAPLLLDLATRDRSVRVRRAAAHLLGCQPPDRRAAEGLRRVAGRDPDSRVRRNARWALAQHTRARAGDQTEPLPVPGRVHP